MKCSKEDWAAAMSSEIFREYLKNELIKEAQAPKEPTVQEIHEQLETFEKKIKNDPGMLKAFKVLQNKFATDQVYADTVNPAFVAGVLMLNLSDEE